MRRITDNKKGVSEIVSYVLLISITFAVAGIVYSWLMFYVTPGKEVKCDEGISLTIRDFHYNCTPTGLNPKNLNLTLQNRGLFNIDGYIVRVNNETESKMGIYTLNKIGHSIEAGDVYYDYYSNASKLNETSRNLLKGNIYFIEVQPFVYQNGTVPIYCDNVAKQNIVCS